MLLLSANPDTRFLPRILAFPAVIMYGAFLACFGILEKRIHRWTMFGFLAIEINCWLLKCTPLTTGMGFI